MGRAPSHIAQELYLLALAEIANITTLDAAKMARFLRIVLGLELVFLSFIFCFSSIRSGFSGRILRKLHTNEIVKKTW